MLFGTATETIRSALPPLVRRVVIASELWSGLCSELSHQLAGFQIYHLTKNGPAEVFRITLPAHTILGHIWKETCKPLQRKSGRHLCPALIWVLVAALLPWEP